MKTLLLLLLTPWLAFGSYDPPTSSTWGCVPWSWAGTIKFSDDPIAVELTLCTSSLTSIGGPFDVSNCSALTNLNLSILTNVGNDFLASGCSSLTDLNVSALTSVDVNGNFDVSSCSSLASLNLSLLTSIGAFYASGCSSLANLNLSTLPMVNGTFDVSSCSSLTNLNLSLLTSIGGDFLASSCSSLGSLTISALTNVYGNFEVSSCSSLTNLNLSLLTSIGGDFYASYSAITNADLSVWIITDGTSVLFDECALSTSTVDEILARAVASGVTSCTIDLSGGTSAAPSLTGQANYDILTTAGNTVTVNGYPE